MARELSYSQTIQRSIIKTYRKPIWNSFVEACKKYSLINDGDRICVFLCGDASSLLLAYLLLHLKRISTVSFDLALLSTIDLPPEFGLQYTKVDDFENALKNTESMGFNKLAVSPNLNDTVNHTVYYMFYSSCIKGVLPKETAGDTEVIKPLFCIYEKDIEKWKKYNSINYITNIYKDEKAEKLVEKIKKINPDIEHNVFTSIENVKLDTIAGYIKNNEYHSFLENY